MELLSFLIFALLGGLGGVVVFLYFLKRGQFEDCEETKYQIFHDEDD